MSNRQIVCADCGTPVTGRAQDQTPCPSCGSSRREVEIRVQVAATSRGRRLRTGAAQTVRPTGIPSGEQVGRPTVTVDPPVTLTVTGEPADHVAELIFSKRNDAGTLTIEVRDDGTLTSFYLGDDAVDGLLSLLSTMLPPGHPERETLSDQPDDLL